MAFFILSLCPFDISVGVWGFVIGLSQISSFFFFKYERNLSWISNQIKSELSRVGTSFNNCLWQKQMTALYFSYVFLSTDDWNTLMLVGKESPFSIMELWENSIYSNRSNMYLHKSPITDLIQNDYFRSPLIDAWPRLNVKQVPIHGIFTSTSCRMFYKIISEKKIFLLSFLFCAFSILNVKYKRVDVLSNILACIFIFRDTLTRNIKRDFF